MNKMKLLLIILSIFCLITSSCRQKSNIKIISKHKNGKIKEAVTYVNPSDTLSYLLTEYYENGKVKELTHYTNNLVNGKQETFDSTGVITGIFSFFYGINTGDNIFYHSNKPYYYTFSSLESQYLIECTYDSVGSCERLVFHADPKIAQVGNDKGDTGISLFLYLPSPPDFEIRYTLGVIDSSQNFIRRTFLHSDKFFLDTVLSILPNRQKYFIAIDYKKLSNDSIFNRFYGRF